LRSWIRRLAPLLLLLSACPKGQERDAAQATVARDSGATAATTPPVPASFPIHEATRKDAETALRDLEEWTKNGASDPENAWAMAHGLLAFGKDLETSDHRRAIDVLVGDFVEKKRVGKRDVFQFPESSAAKIPVAPHRDIIVKSLLESGVPLDRTFELRKGGTVTLDRLLKDAESTFAMPAEEAGFRNYAWSVSAFLIGRAKEKRIETKTGSIGFDFLAQRTMSELEKEQAFLEEPMITGHPERVEKRKQGIYAHTCGGLHFVQAAILGAAITRRPELIARARRQLDIVLFRWEAERRIYKQALFQQPEYKWILLVQELKFYGHVLETFALAEDWGVLQSDALMKQKLRRVAGDLADTVFALDQAYARQKELRKASEQTYYDLIGDGCHAIRGLRRSLVAFFPA
jgi:hypothetical protein